MKGLPVLASENNNKTKQNKKQNKKTLPTWYGQYNWILFSAFIYLSVWLQLLQSYSLNAFIYHMQEKEETKPVMEAQR